MALTTKNGTPISQEDIDLLEGIGSLFLEARQEAGISQKEAARRAGSCQARVSSLENGSADFMYTTLNKWARIYGYEARVYLLPPGYDEEAVFNQAVEEAVAAKMKEMEHAVE